GLGGTAARSTAGPRRRAGPASGRLAVEPAQVRVHCAAPPGAAAPVAGLCGAAELLQAGRLGGPATLVLDARNGMAVAGLGRAVGCPGAVAGGLAAGPLDPVGAGGGRFGPGPALHLLPGLHPARG